MNAPMAIGDGTPEFAAFLDRLRADGGDKVFARLPYV